jgi:predicted permease
LSALLGILGQVIAPLFIIIGLGYAYERRFSPDLPSLSRLSFYVLSPCLIFNSLVTTELPQADLLRMAVFATLNVLGVTCLAALLARLFRYEPSLASAFTLVALGTNAGNYGLAVNLFAFGQPGLQQALIYFIANAILVNTLGVFVAARGQASVGQALRRVLYVPLVYAVIIGVSVRLLHWQLPTAILKATQLAGQATVPILLLLLGMQLARTEVNQAWRPVGWAVLVKLVASPLLALGLLSLLGLRGLAWQVGLVQAGTPTAVTVTILAGEYDAKPRFVATVVFVSTLLSLVTVTFILTQVM